MSRSRIIKLLSDDDIYYIVKALNILEGQYYESECEELASCVNELTSKIENSIELALILTEKKLS